MYICRRLVYEQRYFCDWTQEDSQKMKSLEKDVKEARTKQPGGGNAEDVRS